MIKVRVVPIYVSYQRQLRCVLCSYELSDMIKVCVVPIYMSYQRQLRGVLCPYM